MIKIPKNFCILPFLHHHVTPQGKMTPCCINDQVMGDVSEKSMEEIFHSESFQKLRQQFLEGYLPESCRICKVNEELNFSSMRQGINNRFRKDVLFYNLVSNPSGELPLYKPKYFDIRFSNRCNLQCRTCGPLASTSWVKEEKHGRYSQLSSGVLNEVFSHLPYIEEIYLAGGEPLLMKENILMIDEVKKHNPQIRIIYNTNLSTLTFQGTEYIELWKGLGNLLIYVSLDDLYEKGDYLRSGINFSLFLDNIHALAKAKIDFSFHVVVSVFNAFSLRELIKFFDKNFPKVEVSYALLLTPFHLQISAFPPSIKLVLKKELESLLELELRDDHRSILKTMLLELDTENSHYFEEMISFIKELDKRRNESFKEIYPSHPLANYL